MLDNVLQYYGMDWGTLCFGLIGCYLVSIQNCTGFLFNILACVCGLMVAVMSGQYGFIVYNIVLIIMTARGYAGWMKKQNESVAALGAE